MNFFSNKVPQMKSLHLMMKTSMLDKKHAKALFVRRSGLNNLSAIARISQHFSKSISFLHFSRIKYMKIL